GDYYSDPSVGVIEFLGVEEVNRGRGLGSALEEEFVRRVAEDARHAGRELRGIFVEVEDPEAVGKWGSVSFWSKRRYRFVPIRYVQPPLSPGKRPATNLRLMFRPIPESPRVSGALVLAFLRSYFHYAMSIEVPEATAEYSLARSQAEGAELTLEEPGSVLVHGFSLRLFAALDARGEPPEVGRIPRVRYGREGRSASGELHPEILAREGRDLANLRESYLRDRSVLRFGPLDSFHVSVVRGDGVELALGDAVVIGSYKSLGVLVLETIIRGSGPRLLPTLIASEDPSNLRADGGRLLDRLSELARRVRKDAAFTVVYPLLIIESMEGDLRPDEIYGLVNVDASYSWVSEAELHRTFCGAPRSCDRSQWVADLSVVKGVLAMYEPRAALVVGRDRSAFLDAFEEIYGIPLQRFTATLKGVDPLVAAEAEYSAEVELLVEQLSVLSSLHEMLSSWEGREDAASSEEYAELMELEGILHLRMRELHAIDVGIYESLRGVLRSAQRRMGIEELRSVVEDQSSALRRDIDVRYQLSEDRRLLQVQFMLAVLAIFQAALAGITVAIALGYSPTYTAAAAATMGAAAAALTHWTMFRRRPSPYGHRPRRRRRWIRGPRDTRWPCCRRSPTQPG
ncbi:MAG: hypothetical protein ACP5NG_02890, partial [Conexivisphaera sp.]